MLRMRIAVFSIYFCSFYFYLFILFLSHSGVLVAVLLLGSISNKRIQI